MIKSLERGRKYFEKDNCEYGLAKINLLEAEFQIDNKYGTGIILNYNSKEVKNMLDKAYLTFKKLGIENI